MLIFNLNSISFIAESKETIFLTPLNIGNKIELTTDLYFLVQDLINIHKIKEYKIQNQ